MISPEKIAGPWLVLAWKLSKSGMSLRQFEAVYAPKIDAVADPVIDDRDALASELLTLRAERDEADKAATAMSSDLFDIAEKLTAAEAQLARQVPERGWCQPKDMKHRVWIVMYEDADRGNAVFTNEHAEQQAKEQYVRSAPSWNCYLFAAQPELIGTPEGDAIEDRLAGRIRSTLSPEDSEAECPDCGRHVMADPQPATGFIAKCGRRLTRLSECRPTGCTEDSQP